MEKLTEFKQQYSLSGRIVPFTFIFSTVFIIFFSFKAWVYIRYQYPEYEVFPRHILYGIICMFPCFVLLIYSFFQTKQNTKSTLQDVSFLVFIAWCTISTTYSINSAAALEGLYFWYLLLILYYCFNLIFANYRSTEKYLIFSFVVLTLFFIGNYWHRNFDVLSNLGQDSDKTFQKTVRHLWSILGTKNVSAMFLFCVFCTYFSLTVSLKKYQIPHYIFQGICLFAILAIGSRNVYLGLTIFFLTYFLWVKQSFSKEHLYRVLIILASFALFFILIDTNKFVDHISFRSFFSRQKMWVKSLDFLRENGNPFIGVGIYQFDIIKPLFRLEYFSHPHNDHLRALFELGIIGMILHTYIFISQLFLSIKFINLSSSKRSILKVKALMSFLIAYQSIMFFDGIEYKIAHQAIIIIAWARLNVLFIEEPNLVTPRFNNVYRYITPVILIGLTIYSGYFLHARKQHIAAERMLKFDRYHEAVETMNHINKNIYYDPLKTPIHTQLGNGCLSIKGCDAKNLYLKALKYYPYNIETKVKLVDEYIKEKNVDKAFEYLETIDYNSTIRDFVIEKYEELNKIMSKK